MPAFRVCLLTKACRVCATTAEGIGPCSLHGPRLRGITKCPRSQAPMGRLPWIQRTAFHITGRAWHWPVGLTGGWGSQLMIGKLWSKSILEVAPTSCWRPGQQLCHPHLLPHSQEVPCAMTPRTWAASACISLATWVLPGWTQGYRKIFAWWSPWPLPSRYPQCRWRKSAEGRGTL